MRRKTIKNTRVNGEVKKELSILIGRDIKDPRIHPMTSVLDVEVAPDLKTAKIYISVMGDEEARNDTYQGLRSAASYMRSQLAKTLNLRNTPELTFIMDNSIEYGANMSKLIDEINSKSRVQHEEETEIEAEDDTEDYTEEDAED